jgi:hypothetical protein
MRKQILTLLGACLFGLMHSVAAQAALDFTFSFTGTVPPGDVAGTVTGKIFGLTEGATSSATNVIVTSYPAALEPPAPPQTGFVNVAANSFTVNLMGEITAAEYIALNNALELGLNVDSGNILLNLTNDDFVQNNDGLAGVTFTPVQPTAIPEPWSVTLLGMGLGVAALWQLRRRSRSRS